MTEPRTRHDEIMHALAALIAADPFFPAPEMDAPEPTNLRAAVPGAVSSIRDHCTVQSEEPSEVTREGGSEVSWELEGRFSVVYAVAGGELRERRARRDAAVRHLEAIVEGNRTLGLGDPQIYAELGPVERGNEIAVKGTAGFALALIPVNVQYVARSAAG